MNQVERLSRKAGSDAELARLSGDVHPSQVLRWKRGSGFVPARRHPIILENARKQNIPITEADFFGDPAKKIPKQRRGVKRKASAS